VSGERSPAPKLVSIGVSRGNTLKAGSNKKFREEALKKKFWRLRLDDDSRNPINGRI
jgi:hypothetical protein